ncbi:MAG: DUF4407 domain-containing protein [Hydrogenophilales bacterium]|nr:DUF4407 domain-containing protein [Hydrogenophilales bacterium]
MAETPSNPPSDTLHPSEPTAENSPGNAPDVGVHFTAFQRFLLWLSKTDLHVAWHICTAETLMTQRSIGGMVLTTGIFAWMSSFFAVQSTFFEQSHGFFAYFIPLMVGLFYGSAIMLFDREIVSAPSKNGWMIFARISFAICLGFVLSYPMEMKLLEGAIKNQVERDTRLILEDNFQRIANIDDAHKQAEADYYKNSKEWSAKERLVRDKAEVSRKIDEWVIQVHDEAKKVRCDVRCNKIKEELRAYEADKTRIENELKGLNPSVFMPDAKLESMLVEQSKLKERVAKLTAGSTDFLSRSRALENIIDGRNQPAGFSKSNMAFIIAWSLTLFFILFELFPVLIKIFMPENEYHAYLNARRALMIQKINVYTSIELQLIKDNPDEAMRAGEMTDSLESVMEDPMHRTRWASLLTRVWARLRKDA